jgi:hypothetical protein
VTSGTICEWWIVARTTRKVLALRSSMLKSGNTCL